MELARGEGRQAGTWMLLRRCLFKKTMVIETNQYSATTPAMCRLRDAMLLDLSLMMEIQGLFCFFKPHK